MAKKKEGTAAAPIVPVDIGKLSHGLTTTFMGVSEIFDSIGAQEKPGFGIVENASADEGMGSDEAEDAAGASNTSDALDTSDEPESSDEPGEPESTDVHAAEAASVEAEAAAEQTDTNGDAPADAGEAGDEKPDEKKPANANAFTLDDLMKVAATKIKKDNKKYSEKIGALVKTYGVTSLKELPEEKFEAFMTDLSQL